MVKGGSSRSCSEESRNSHNTPLWLTQLRHSGNHGPLAVTLASGWRGRTWDHVHHYDGPHHAGSSHTTALQQQSQAVSSLHTNAALLTFAQIEPGYYHYALTCSACVCYLTLPTGFVCCLNEHYHCRLFYSTLATMDEHHDVECNKHLEILCAYRF